MATAAATTPAGSTNSTTASSTTWSTTTWSRPGRWTGRSEVLGSGMRAALPDLTATVEDTVAEGNKLAARVTFAGTNSGTLSNRLMNDAWLEFE